MHTVYLTITGGAVAAGLLSLDTVTFTKTVEPFSGSLLARLAGGSQGFLTPAPGAPTVTTVGGLSSGAVLDFGSVDFTRSTSAGPQLRYLLSSGLVKVEVMVDGVVTWTITALPTLSATGPVFATSPAPGGTTTVTGVHHLTVRLTDRAPNLPSVPYLTLNYVHGE